MKWLTNLTVVKFKYTDLLYEHPAYRLNRICSLEGLLYNFYG